MVTDTSKNICNQYGKPGQQSDLNSIYKIRKQQKKPRKGQSMLHLVLLIGATKMKLILPYTGMEALAKTFPHH